MKINPRNITPKSTMLIAKLKVMKKTYLKKKIQQRKLQTFIQKLKARYLILNQKIKKMQITLKNQIQAHLIKREKLFQTVIMKIQKQMYINTAIINQKRAT